MSSSPQPISPAAPATLADLLVRRAAEDPDRIAYEFVDADLTVASLTYGELAVRAWGLAERLCEVGDRESPVLLLYPPGPDYVVGLWAALAAGMAAVPAYPPMPTGGSGRPLDRLLHMVGDLAPHAIVAPEQSHDALGGLTQASGGAAVPLLSVHGTSKTPPEATGTDPTHLAVIQYTSGSTRSPKGVRLTHGNLLSNVEAIRVLFGLDAASRALVWLPPYHDMGLIGGILTPAYTGFPVRLMSPLHFLKTPLDWLRQISDSRATVSGGPNFAYELVLRRLGADDAALAGIDLSSWQVAFNGAEPVRARTLHAFSNRMAKVGFRAEAFLPCYGLAEASLVVTGAHWRGGDGTVGCGAAVAGHRVAVVDEKSGQPAPEGQEGEIWVSGPSVSHGYWTGPGGEPNASALASLNGSTYLRTGDLGFLRDGELFVSGRHNDVLVHRGVNYHAADIEDAAHLADTGLRPTAAAFMADREPDGPAAVLVIAHGRLTDTVESVATRIRTRVLELTGLSLDAVALVPSRSIPRTSSGKVQRGLCRSRYMDGAYDTYVVLGTAAGSPAPEVTAERVVDHLTTLLCGVFAGVRDLQQCAPTQSLADIGGDSLAAAHIADIVEQALGLPVEVAEVLTTPTPRSLAESLISTWKATDVTLAQVEDRVRELIGGMGG